MQTVKRTAEFQLFKSSIVEVMPPLTLKTGGIPLRVARLPASGNAHRKASNYVTDNSQMDVQEVTFFTHAFDEHLTAEELEIIWSFRLFTKGLHLAFIDEAMRMEIMSLSGQIQIPHNPVALSSFWQESHWIKFFDIYAEAKRTKTQGILGSVLPSQFPQSGQGYASAVGSTQSSGFSTIPVANKILSVSKNPSSVFTIPRPRPATDAEKARVTESAPYSYTKLDMPLSQLFSGKVGPPPNHDTRAMTRRGLASHNQYNRTSNTFGAPSGTFKVDAGSDAGPHRIHPKCNRQPERGAVRSNDLRSPGEVSRPLNVYGKDVGRSESSIAKKPLPTRNRVWVNSKRAKVIAPKPPARNNVDTSAMKQFVISAPTEEVDSNEFPLLTPQSPPRLTYEQRLTTVDHLNSLINTRGDDIFAILRYRCPGLLRQSGSSDIINLTQVPDAVLRELYNHVIMSGPVHLEPLQEAPSLNALSDNDMEFLWTEYPRLAPDEKYELSRIMEATAPSVQHRVINNSGPLARILPVTVQHFILKYVTDRKNKWDEVVAESERILENEHFQELKEMANAMLAEQKNKAAQDFEEEIWKQRDEALDEEAKNVLTDRDVLFGPSSKRETQ